VRRNITAVKRSNFCHVLPIAFPPRAGAILIDGKFLDYLSFKTIRRSNSFLRLLCSGKVREKQTENKKVPLFFVAPFYIYSLSVFLT